MSQGASVGAFFRGGATCFLVAGDGVFRVFPVVEAITSNHSPPAALHLLSVMQGLRQWHRG